jgi:hypothetical protein
VSPPRRARGIQTVTAVLITPMHEVEGSATFFFFFFFIETSKLNHKDPKTASAAHQLKMVCAI